MRSLLVDYVAGVCGGVTVVLVGHPFDTTKTRLQVSPKGFYAGTLDCVSKTWRHEGLRGFYAGMSSPMLGQMLFRATSFMTFHSTLQTLSPPSLRATDGPVPASSVLQAGAITGLLIAFIETPIDLIKTKMQIQGINFASGTAASTSSSSSSGAASSSVTAAVRSVLAQHGPRGLFQGLSATMIRNVPANALFFPVNEMVKEAFVRRKDVERRGTAHSSGGGGGGNSRNLDGSGSLAPLTQRDLEMWERVVSGACAGLCYWVGTYPLDLVKGKVMAAPFSPGLTWAGCVREILRAEGLAGLYRGLLPCAVRAVPACSALFVTMDVVKLRLS